MEKYQAFRLIILLNLFLLIILAGLKSSLIAAPKTPQPKD
jgi:hypothetical protein